MRTPYDGKPYYCAVCGIGFAEYMACEEADCALEGPDHAERRRELFLGSRRPRALPAELEAR